MVDIQKMNPGWFDHRTDIPQWIASGIGQVCAEWAVLERELEELIRLLMDIDIKDARIICNWMNAKTRVATIQSIIQARIIDDKLKTPRLEKFTKLAEKIEHKLQPKRDILAHGLWGKHKGKWCTLKMRQSRKTPQLEPDLKKLSRAVLPQREIVNRAAFRGTAREIQATTSEIEAFCDAVAIELAPLRNTRPQYTRRKRSYRP